MKVAAAERNGKVIRTQGEIDLSNVSSLRAALDEALAASPEGFAVDLSASRYIDSSGIAALVYAYKHLHARGGRLALVVTDHFLMRILSITNLHVLPGLFICETLDDALRVITENQGSDPATG